MYTKGDTSSTLLPIKFMMIFVQNLLVYFIIMSRDDYIYGDVGARLTNTEKETPELVLVIGCVALWFDGYFEILMMIVGTNVPFVYAKYNMIQIVLHFLGCLFLLWFILDTWNYIRIWYIFTLCSVLPLVLEIVMWRQASLMKTEIKRNRERI